MTITPSQRHKLNRDPVSQPHVILLEFSEDGQDVVIRAAVNNEDIVHQGELYVATNISVVLPSAESEDVSATLIASNQERILGRAIDRAKRRITVRMMMIDVSLPDIAIMDTQDLMVAESATVNGAIISLSLGPRASMQEPVPTRRTTRNSFPGVWAP